MTRRRVDRIRVYVVEFGREKLMLRVRYPGGSKIRHETVDTSDRNEAERLAALREKELNENAGKPDGRLPWDVFRRKAEEQLIAGLKPKTRQKYSTVFNAVERFIGPAVVGDLTTSAVSDMVGQWRRQGATDGTLFGCLGHLRAALVWAVEQGFLQAIPVIRKPRLISRNPTKGRAVDEKEFAAFRDAASSVVGADNAPAWTRLLDGLHLSGLRLNEALSLSWDIPDTIRVDFTGRFPMLLIPGDRQKNNEAQLWPIVPEFAVFLRRTPKAKRTGFVFAVPGADARRVDTVSSIIVDIGKASSVIVDPGRDKHVSAHDLRRSFGVRWADRVQPHELQLLMRHADIETTLRYYVRQRADQAAEKLWESGKLSGNTTNKSKSRKR